tara:strand:- start:484 stop:999 length:516 start_codon:yes stop_codon:yes gene_type:complete
MIIQCNSCSKAFVVPDEAITASGRLVQCSSCGNKWTQYPLKQEIEKKVNQIKIATKKSLPNKTLKRERGKAKKKGKPNVYSPEYLQKKHGIKLIDPSTSIGKNVSKKITNKNNSFGFYNFVLTATVLIIFIYGTLNLTKEIIIFNYPFTEMYVNYFFETIDNLKMIFYSML